METHFRLFKSVETESKYMEAYEATLKEWPVAFDSMDVKTQHGCTHIISCGSKTGYPLILLHAGYASSTMWFPNILELSRNNHVLAIDTIGEPGKSIPIQAIPSKREMANWLVGVFDEMDIKQANVAGLSRGGWLSLNLAIHAPERVKKLCLLSPAAAFVSLNKFFGFVASSVMRIRTRPVMNAALNSWVAKDFKINPVFREQFIIGLKNWQYPKVGIMPLAFESHELRNISMPVLMLIGDQDRLNNHRSIECAIQSIPQIETGIIPNAGHFLSMDQAAIVSARILNFLESIQDQPNGR
jgi:pimeloyl-ACP methyl ester carboxylesterase